MPPTTATNRVRSLLRSDSALALLVFVLCMGIYLPTISPSVVLGDGGEAQMLSAVLGVSHPTGYPLFMLLGWLFGHLPLGGDHAFRVTLLCTFSTAAAMALLCLTVRELGGGRAPALAAALLAAAVPRVWMHASAAEVYPLSSFFGILGIWLLLRWESGKTPLWAVALAFGFGLTHHISLRLFAPAVVVFLLLVDPRLPLRPRSWLPALGCLLLPLALYAYVPLRAGHFIDMPELAGRILGVRKVVASGYVSQFYFSGGALGLILALGYSGQFLSGGIRLDVIKDYLALAQQQFPVVAGVVAIALVGIIALFRRRWRANVLFLIIYAVVMFASLQHLSTVGEDGDHFIPTFLLTAVWFGMGADTIISLLTRSKSPRSRWLRHALSIAVCALAIYAIAKEYPQALKWRQVEVVAGVTDQPLPTGAVLTGDWIYVTPLRYRQRVDGLRPDLWIIHANPDGTRLIMADAITERVPLYAIRPTLAGFRLLPLPVWEPTEISHPANTRLSPAVRWRGWDLGTNAAKSGDVLPITLYWQADARPESDWTTFIHLIDANGEKVGQVDQVPGDGFYPPSAWQPGLLVADQYELPLDSKLQPGTYKLIFGSYRGGDRLTWADGQDTRELAEIAVGER